MHPSLTAKLNLPKDLEPRRQMPVNDPCWCGSGAKWKKCHRDREHQKPISFGELMRHMRDAGSTGCCLHPQASASTCGSKIIQAHTVQRKGGLEAIAEEGHVISPKRGVEDIFKNDGEIVPRLLGVRVASTFLGFCDKHDDQLFSPIEKAPITLSKETAFLLSFRAICYEISMKKGSLLISDIMRQMDKGKPFEIQCEIQQYVHFYREGTRRGIRDLKRWKSKYDAAYISRIYDNFSFYSVMFADVLPIVACGSFYPEFDFAGNPLQILERGSSEFENVCFNLTAVGNKSLAVLGWSGIPQGPAECFVQSFSALPKDSMANAAFYLASEHLENIYFRPSWWNSQPDPAKKYLERHFESGTPLRDRSSDCLSRFEHTFAIAAVNQELNS